MPPMGYESKVYHKQKQTNRFDDTTEKAGWACIVCGS